MSKRLSDLKKILKFIRFPLIPAEILVKKVYTGKLVETEDLFVATAFQAAPDVF